MGQTYSGNIKKAKAARYSAMDLKNLHILPENSAEGLRSRREHCQSYVVSVFENVPKNLVIQGRVQLDHSSRIRMVLRLHPNTSIPDIYWRKRPNWQAHLELCHRNPDIQERDLNQIALCNSTVGELQQLRNKNDPPFRQTINNS